MSNLPPPAEYRDVPDWPGYRIGNDGSLFSCRSHNSHPGGNRLAPAWHSKKATPQKSGHLYVMLNRDGFQQRIGVHTLVLWAFVGPRPAGLECCHYDGNPANNRLDNLRWDTPKANAADTIRHGRKARGADCSWAKLTEENVHEIKRLLSLGEPKRRIARQFRVRDYTIKLIADGVTWKHVDGPPPAERCNYRPGKVSPEQLSQARRMRGDGALQREIALAIGIHQSAVSRLLRNSRHRQHEETAT